MDPVEITEEKVTELGEANGYFKFNLPDTFESYRTGNGEGIWAVALTKELTEEIDKGRVGQFHAYAANDPVYYPNLKCGSRILGETRGADNRPVAVWDDLQGTKSAPDNKKETFKKMAEHNARIAGG